VSGSWEVGRLLIRWIREKRTWREVRDKPLGENIMMDIGGVEGEDQRLVVLPDLNGVVMGSEGLVEVSKARVTGKV
jgi:hypothetical protein